MSSSVEQIVAQAKACIASAIAAVEPEALVYEKVSELLVSPSPLASPSMSPSPTHVIAFGKAAPAMARGAVRAIAEANDRRRTDDTSDLVHQGSGTGVGGGPLPEAPAGLVLVPKGYPDPETPGLKTMRGEHPVPGEGSLRGATALKDLLTSLGPNDRLLCLVSGGGSALLTLPSEPLTLADVQATTKALLGAGATIEELNTVRKHLDELKGGRMAKWAKGVPTDVLILSDVVGDPVSAIASGPFVGDPTTFGDARNILGRPHTEGDVPEAVLAFLDRGVHGEVPESPSPGDRCFQTVQTQVIGNGRVAAEGAERCARSLGYVTAILDTSLTGEAREVGGMLARLAREVRDVGHPFPPPACLITAGETTVTVKGSGRGGRNHELALGAALALDGAAGIVLVSAGTDGIDGSSPAAGAVVHPTTLAQARDRGLSAEEALRNNDTHTFFEALGDGLVTGSTGTNVGDVQVVLIP